MHPASLYEHDVWPGLRRTVVQPPDGAPEVKPVMMMTGSTALAGEPVPFFVAKLDLDDGDLERLAAGESVYLTLIGSVVPFDVDLQRDDEEATDGGS